MPTVYCFEWPALSARRPGRSFEIATGRLALKSAASPARHGVACDIRCGRYCTGITRTSATRLPVRCRNGICNIRDVSATLCPCLRHVYHTLLEYRLAGFAGSHPAAHVSPADGPWRLICVGTFRIMYKGQDVLLKAQARVIESGCDATVTFLGTVATAARWSCLPAI